MLLVLPLYLSSGRCSLTLVCPKVWSAIPDSVKSSAHLYLEWQLKKHFSHEKDTLPNYVFQ